MRPYHRLALLLLLAACGEATRKPIAIGDGLPRSDNEVSFLRVQKDALDSARLSQTRVAKWTLQLEDFDRSEGAQAEIFVSDPSVVAVVGHGGSKGTLLALPAYRAGQMPLVVPTSTSNALINAGPNVFMLSPPDGIEGEFLADAAADSLRGKRIAVVYVADAYGIGLRDGVVAGLTKRGMRLAGDAAISGKECYNVPSQALDGILRALIRRAAPDVIILAIGGFQVSCAVPMIRAVQPTVPVLAGDSFEPDVPASRRLSVKDRVQLYYVSFWGSKESPEGQAYIARAKRVIGKMPSAGDALNHDAYMAIAAAIKSGARTRTAITAYLQALGTPGHPPIAGATGPVSFREPRRNIMRLERMPMP